MSYFTETLEDTMYMLETKEKNKTPEHDHPKQYGMKHAADMAKKFDDKKEQKERDSNKADYRDRRLDDAHEKAAKRIPTTKNAPSAYAEKINKDHNTLKNSSDAAFNVVDKSIRKNGSEYDSTRTRHAMNKVRHKMYKDMERKHGKLHESYDPVYADLVAIGAID